MKLIFERITFRKNDIPLYIRKPIFAIKRIQSHQ